jgi:hypothetical protein
MRGWTFGRKTGRRGKPACDSILSRGAPALAAAVLISGAAVAGPPFRTDDPEPVELGHYEFYTFFTGTHITGDTSGAVPGFELNYGLIPNGQFHIVAPLAFDSPVDGSRQWGMGDTELGFKYRFIQEDEKGWRPQVGVFPFLELPTGDEARGLGSGHARLYLPLWVQKSFGDWTTYGGGGYWFNRGGIGGDKDFLYLGWLLQRKVTEKLAIGAELFYQTKTTIDGKDSTGFNIGAIYDFDAHNHLLVSVGRGLQNAPETNRFSWYIAYQITY